MDGTSLDVVGALRPVGVVALAGGVSWAVRRAQRWLPDRADPTLVALIVTAIRVVVWLSASLAVLDALGIDTRGLLTSLGVLGMTLGFAAQDTLANVISGLFILIDRPFVLGDLVQLDGEYGVVDAITLRSVRVVTPDGRMVAIPNRVAASSKAISYTNFPHLRLDVELSIGVGEDIERVRRVLLGVVEGDPGLLRSPAPYVVVSRLGDWFITVQLSAWLDDERDHVLARHRLREAAFLALRDAGVDMPYETVVVHGRPAAGG